MGESILYISSGLKNGFYTLRLRSDYFGRISDMYLKNLSTDKEKAVTKGQSYFDAHYTGTNTRYAGVANFDLTPWGQNLKPWEIIQIQALSNGVWPYGKHKDQPINDSDDGYIKFWATQDLKKETRVVSRMLIEKCKAIADDRGLFKPVQKDLFKNLNEHFGKVDDRVELTLTCVYAGSFEGQYGPFWIVSFKDKEGRSFVYKGASPVTTDRGTVVHVKATVKAHTEYQETHQTVLSRITKIKEPA